MSAIAGRRTHGAYRTKREATEAAHDLVHLLNGVPVGYVLLIGQRLGAWVLFSQRSES